AIEARTNCAKMGNDEWFSRHTDSIEQLQYFMPSGSGVDCGTKVDLDKSTGNKIVLYADFHHMNDGGMYDGWTNHVVTVTPAFDGFNLSISGRDRNGIKEYLADTFHNCLSISLDHTAEGYSINQAKA